MRRAVIAVAALGLMLGAAGTVAASHETADDCGDADETHAENVDEATLRANAWYSTCAGASAEANHPLVICDGPHTSLGPAHAQLLSGAGCESGAQIEVY